MSADKHRLIALNSVSRILDFFEKWASLSASQQVKALKEVEDLAMIARMAMQRVVDIEGGAQ